MTDVVYLLGNGANNVDNRPLRWSLRSLAKHATNVGRVIVCGYIPEWLSDEVVKIPNQPLENRGKHWSMFHSIKKVVDELGLTKPFLVSSDDHYLCKDADLDEWPRYWRGQNLPSIKQLIAKRITHDYAQNLVKTRLFLERNGLSFKAACLHLNTWANPQDVISAWELANKHEGYSVYGLEPTCLINAMFEKRMTSQGLAPKYTVYKHDKKVSAPADCEDKIRKGCPAFSTCPEHENDEQLVKWMDNYYCEPSKWEM